MSGRKTSWRARRAQLQLVKGGPPVVLDTALAVDVLDELAEAENGSMVLAALQRGGLYDLLDAPWRTGLRDVYFSYSYRFRAPASVSLRKWLSEPDSPIAPRAYGRAESMRQVRFRFIPFVREALTRKLVDEAADELVRSVGAPPREPEALARWCEQTRTSFYLTARARLLAPTGGDDEESTKWFDHDDGMTLLEAFEAPAWTGSNLWRRGSRKVPPAVVTDLAAGLLDVAARRALADSFGDTKPVTPPDPERTPRLAQLASRVSALLEQQVAALGPGWLLEVVNWNTVLSLDPPTFDAAMHPSGNTGAQLGLSLDRPVQPLTLGSRWTGMLVSPAIRAACKLLLRRLGEEPDKELRALEADLGRRPIDRLLDSLTVQTQKNWGFELRRGSEGPWLALLEVTQNRSGRPKFKTCKLSDFDDAATCEPDLQKAVSALLGEQQGMDLRDSQWTELQRNPHRIAAALLAARHLPHLYIKAPKRQALDVVIRHLDLAVAREEELTLTLRIGGVPATDRQLEVLARHGALSSPVMFIDADAATVTLVPITGAQRELARGLIKRGRAYPAEAADAVLARLDSIVDAVPVALPDSLAGAPVPADPRLVVRLELVSAGVRIAFFAQPLDGGALHQPGLGAKRDYGVQEGVRVHADRDLRDELARAHGLQDRLDLAPFDDPDLPFRWTLEDLGYAGQLVGALQAQGDVRVLWRGKRGRVRPPLGLGKLKLALKPLGDWFQVAGSLRVGKAEVPLAELVLAAEQGRKFVPVGPGDWAELDAALIERLEPLAAAMRASDDGTSLSALHGGVLHGLEDEVEALDVPAEWAQSSERLAESVELEIEPPAGLRAELRPYQRDGVRWLGRLAHWAPGAVLADDMGLGKTVQALALLLRRADDGPALVVAPASVGFNWAREAARFAPGLRVREYRGPGRASLLADLAAGDLLVTSWSLMAQDRAALAGVRFSTVVFDEAQAMKNRATARNKAARALTAGFRLALTGTPLENHVGELHALLSVVLPGLLGGAARFRERFHRPIAAGDGAASKALSRLIGPFVLRRLKSQVAEDLPARIEVEEHIQLSAAERALYDRVRVAAIAELELARELNEQQRRFRALGLLTTLRQAACHPRLVDEESKAPASKLARLVELLDELRGEGHRALVFSQFVGHLKLVQRGLEEAGYRVLYLDGSTPTAARGALVDRFQAGEADAFLISLKAGGTGLNLTAATYVFHMDPWWNPAAEDQATDRAHRIGQSEAVTVYRLIARGTVEEGILGMHAAKRKVAADVLSGTGSSRAVHPDELAALIMSDGEVTVDDEVDDEVEGAAGEDDVAVDAAEAQVEDAPAAKAQGEDAPAAEAQVEDAPGAQVGGPPAAKAQGEDAPAAEPAGPSFRSLLVPWEADLDAQIAAGDLGERSARNYRLVAADIAAWVGAGASLDDADAAIPEILAAMERGEWTGGKTVRHQGRTVLRRIRAWARASAADQAGQ